MAKSSAKLFTTFDLKKMANRLNKVISDSLNVHGKRVNKDIQDGLKAGKDLNDSSFEPLSENTKRTGGSKPLVRSGTLGQTRVKQSTPGKEPVYEIRMVGKSGRTGEIYGAFHNTGYTNSPKARFPGAKVPQRKWFGISVRMAPGSDAYKKYELERHLRIKSAFKKFGI
tara:strand:+ start:593 stop:1099 length:507 start_codon:yes stop_codon:yes gene_type:complete